MSNLDQFIKSFSNEPFTCEKVRVEAPEPEEGFEPLFESYDALKVKARIGKPDTSPSLTVEFHLPFDKLEDLNPAEIMSHVLGILFLDLEDMLGDFRQHRDALIEAGITPPATDFLKDK